MFSSRTEERLNELEKRIRELEWTTRIADPRFDNKIGSVRWVGFDYFYCYIFTPLLKNLGYEIKVQPETLKIEKSDKANG